MPDDCGRGRHSSAATALGARSKPGRGPWAAPRRKLAWKNGAFGQSSRSPRRLSFNQRQGYKHSRRRAICHVRESIRIDAAGGLRHRFTRHASREFHASLPKTLARFLDTLHERWVSEALSRQPRAGGAERGGVPNEAAALAPRLTPAPLLFAEHQVGRLGDGPRPEADLPSNRSTSHALVSAISAGSALNVVSGRY